MRLVILILLILYLLAGVSRAPLHGDEPTIISLSRDFDTLVLQGNPAALFFRDPPPDADFAADQELRLLNGPLAPLSFGAARLLVGIPAERINKQWLWGADLDFNRANGHVPDDQLLFVARWTSALFGAVSIAAVYAVARRLIGRGAWLAALIYATLPAVLLNARRAVFEGALLCMLGLALLLAVDLARRMERRGPVSWRHWLGLGIAAGLAVTAKHTAVIVFPPALAALLWVGRRTLPRTLVRTALVVLTAGVVFFALNPAWWQTPLRVPGEVLRLRSDLLAGQTAAFGGFGSVGERLCALGSAPLGLPQYYEVAPGWPEWIGGQIAAYESAGLAGIGWGGLGIAGLVFALVGLAVIVWRRGAAGLVFGAVTLFFVAALLALNPVPWQRYYLPLAMPYALALGGGVCAVVGALWRAARVRHVK